MCTAVGPTSSQLRARQSFHLSPTALSVWSGGVDSGRERRRRPRGPKLCRSGSGRSAQDPHTKLIHLFFDHRARPSIIPAPSGTLPQRKNQGRARQPAGSSVRLFSFLSFPLIFFFYFYFSHVLAPPAAGIWTGDPSREAQRRINEWPLRALSVLFWPHGRLSAGKAHRSLQPEVVVDSLFVLGQRSSRQLSATF